VLKDKQTDTTQDSDSERLNAARFAHHVNAQKQTSQPAGNAPEGEKFLSLHEAARMTGYHQDYLGQMARSGKLEARKLGRNWVTTKYAIDKMLGRIPDAAEVNQIPEQPVIVSAPELNVVHAEVVIPETPKPVGEKITNIKFAGKVSINHLRISPDAGPSLQEALLERRTDNRVDQTILKTVEAKNVFAKWERITGPRRMEDVNRHAIENLKVRMDQLSREVRGDKKLPAFRLNLNFLSFKNSLVPIMALVIIFTTAATYTATKVFSNNTNDPVVSNAESQLSTDESKVAGASTSTVGREVILSGTSEKKVLNENVMPTSKISITFRSDFSGRYWVTNQADGTFTVKLSEPSAQGTIFDYWIAEEKEGGGL
jgi:hypothetical protein